MSLAREWWETLPGDPMGWLLASPSAALVGRVLVELVGRPVDSPAVRRAVGRANIQEPIASLLKPLLPDGSWATAVETWEPGGGGWRLVAAAMLGADATDPRTRLAWKVVLDRRDLPTGWDEDDGPSHACATARCVAAAAELGYGMHRTVLEALARFEAAESWACPVEAHHTDVEGCPVAAVGLLSALGAEPRLQRPELLRRAGRIACGVDGGDPGFPNLLRTDFVEAGRALARAGHPADPQLRPVIEQVWALGKEGGRWPGNKMEPREVPQGTRELGAEDVSRWVTLWALVALKRYALPLGFERRFPEPPAAG